MLILSAFYASIFPRKHFLQIRQRSIFALMLDIINNQTKGQISPLEKSL